MWSFYGIELSDVSDTRAGLLLRVLVVDAQPFQTLLTKQFEGQDDWQLRYVAIHHSKEASRFTHRPNRIQSLLWLFRMVLDVTNPAFVLDDRQWRSSIIDIFYHFFSALWLDDRVGGRIITLLCFYSDVNCRKKFVLLLRPGHRHYSQHTTMQLLCVGMKL